MTTGKIAGISGATYKTNRRRGGDPHRDVPGVGTPLSPPPTAPGGASSYVPRTMAAVKPPAPPPSSGDEVSYRSAALGEFYPAVVLFVRLDGTLDIDVLVSPPLTLTKRQWWADDPRACPRQACTVAGLRGSIEIDG